MSVYRGFIKTALKLRANFIMYLGIFAALVVLLSSNASGGSGAGFKETKAEIAVMDEDGTVASKALTEYMGRNCRIIDVKKDNLKDSLFQREVVYVLNIKSGFEGALLNGDATGYLTSNSVAGSDNSYLCSYKAENYMKYLSLYVESYELSEAIKKADETTSIEATTLMHSENSDNLEMMSLFFRYLPYAIFCMLMCGLGNVLIVFRNREINMRMLCSAMPLFKRNIALIAGCITYALVALACFVFLSVFMFKGDIASIKGALYILNAFVFVIFGVVMTFLASLIATNSGILNLIANVIGLSMSFLGGIFVPMEIMSNGVKSVARFLPSFWYIRANEFVTMYAGDSSQLGKYFGYIGIEFLFAAVVFVGALVVTKAKASKGK